MPWRRLRSIEHGTLRSPLSKATRKELAAVSAFYGLDVTVLASVGRQLGPIYRHPYVSAWIALGTPSVETIAERLGIPSEKFMAFLAGDKMPKRYEVPLRLILSPVLRVTYAVALERHTQHLQQVASLNRRLGAGSKTLLAEATALEEEVASAGRILARLHFASTQMNVLDGLG